jgi:hypothetical protein
LSQGEPGTIIVFTGTDGAAHIGPEVEGWAKANNLNLLVQPSYEAVTRLDELVEQKKKVAALMHISWGINFMSIWFFCNVLSCASCVLFHMDK